MNTKLILRIAVAFIAIQFSRAQAQGEISLRFLSFPNNNSTKPIELLVGEGKTIPIEIPGNELSPAYKLPRPASIVVGITAKNDKGEPIFEVFGKAPPLSSSKQIILLMRKGADNSDGFVVIPIDGDLTKFSGGNYLFINASKLPIGGKIGNKVFKLDPGQKDLIEPAPTHEGGACQVTLTYQNAEKWKIFYDTRWSVSKRYRSLVFFYQDPESETPGVAPIVEML